LVFLPNNDNIFDVIAVKPFIYISNIRRVLMKVQKSKTSVKIKKSSLKVEKKSSVKKVSLNSDLQAKFKEAFQCLHRGDQESSKRGRDIFLEIIKTSPKFRSEEGDNPYYYLGIYYADKPRQKKRAIDYFTKAIELNPKDADSLQDRGFCWMELGETSKALKDLKKAKLFGEEAGLHPDLDEFIDDLSNSTK
jgi:tetratricopeptide (TPR) repeat protein